MSFNITHDKDFQTLKLNDNSRISPETIKFTKDNLKISSQNNSNFMLPKLNEEIHRPDIKANIKILDNDINLLGNPKKTKRYSSDEESSSSSSESSVSTIEDSDNGLSRDKTNLLGHADDEDDDENYTSSASDTRSVSSSSRSASEEDTLTSSASSMRGPPQRPKTMEEINQEKQELIYRLERMEQNGFKPARKFTMNNSLEDIKCEYDRIKKQRDVDKSIKFQRKILMAVTSGIEFLNGKFDPLSVKLDGWSESVYENLHEYDDVFEELHEKYKEKVKVAPEIKLLMMVGGSAFMFHLTNTLFKSKMPGLSDILQQNPELARNVQQAAMNSMKQNEEKAGNPDPLFNMMMNQAQNMMGPKPPTRPMGPGVKDMRGPSGVDDILSMVNKQAPSKTFNVDKEDTISSVSSQDSGNRRKIRMRKPGTALKNANGKFVLDL